MTALVHERSPILNRESYFNANLASHRIGVLTKQRLLECEPRGSVVLMSDGTPVLRVGNVVLGEPLDDHQLRLQLARDNARSGIVVFGVGMGHAARALRTLTTAPIIVFEPDPELLRSYLEYGPSDLANVELVSNQHDLTNAWARSVGHCQDAVLVRTPGYARLFPELSAEIQEIVARLVQRVVVTKNTYRLRGRDWIRDVLANVELLTKWPLFAALTGKYKGVPAFIVGAGPSLGKNAELLREAATKGLVFAANSAALALANRQIEPHVIACIESIDVSSRIQELPFKDTAIRAFSLSAAPATLRTGAGPLLPFYESIPQYSRPLEELTGRPGVTVCGSVSTAAFSLAHQLGCSPIVLVGQDMAYTEGRAYASGTGYESSAVTIDSAKQDVCFEWNAKIQALHEGLGTDRHRREPLRELPAWGGQGTVTSGTSLAAVATWLEGIAALLKHAYPSLSLVNATEGGASVPGFEDRPLADVLAELEPRNLSAADLYQTAQASEPPLSRAAIVTWISNQSSYTRATRRAARRLKRLSAIGAKLLDSDDPMLISRCYAAIEKAEHSLKRCGERSPLVDAWACAPLAALSGNLPASDTDAKAAALAAMLRGEQIAEVIETSALELSAELESLQNEMQA